VVFGDVTFAQAPFAALGGNTYSFAVSESAVALASMDAETTLGGVAEEAAAATDTVFNANNTLLATNSETVTATSTQVARADVLALIAELVAGTATHTARTDVLAALSESAAGTASFSVSASVLAAISELATALDASSATIVFGAVISEGATGTDTQTAQVAFIGTVAEAAAADSLSATATINVYPVGVQIYVLIGDVLVWGSIDDNQNPNWQNIGNTQSPAWTVINDEQSPGWTNLPS